MNDYERIAAVIAYLDKHHAEQPSLAVLAKRAGSNTQRLRTRDHVRCKRQQLRQRE
jgi:hypothetical protein